MVVNRLGEMSPMPDLERGGCDDNEAPLYLLASVYPYSLSNACGLRPVGVDLCGEDGLVTRALAFGSLSSVLHGSIGAGLSVAGCAMLERKFAPGCLDQPDISQVAEIAAVGGAIVGAACGALLGAYRGESGPLKDDKVLIYSLCAMLLPIASLVGQPILGGCGLGPSLKSEAVAKGLAVGGLAMLLCVHRVLCK